MATMAAIRKLRRNSKLTNIPATASYFTVKQPCQDDSPALVMDLSFSTFLFLSLSVFFCKFLFLSLKNSPEFQQVFIVLSSVFNLSFPLFPTSTFTHEACLFIGKNSVWIQIQNQTCGNEENVMFSNFGCFTDNPYEYSLILAFCSCNVLKNSFLIFPPILPYPCYVNKIRIIKYLKFKYGI